MSAGIYAIAIVIGILAATAVVSGYENLMGYDTNLLDK